jgi:hypothetical protein
MIPSTRLKILARLRQEYFKCHLNALSLIKGAGHCLALSLSLDWLLDRGVGTGRSGRNGDFVAWYVGLRPCYIVPLQEDLVVFYSAFLAVWFW